MAPGTSAKAPTLEPSTTPLASGGKPGEGQGPAWPSPETPKRTHGGEWNDRQAKSVVLERGGQRKKQASPRRPNAGARRGWAPARGKPSSRTSLVTYWLRGNNEKTWDETSVISSSHWRLGGPRTDSPCPEARHHEVPQTTHILRSIAAIGSGGERRRHALARDIAMQHVRQKLATYMYVTYNLLVDADLGGKFLAGKPLH